MEQAIAEWDLTADSDEAVHTYFQGRPGRHSDPDSRFSQSTRWDTLEPWTRESGCIRSVEHAYSAEGGPGCTLWLNIAQDGLRK